ncbi:DUF3422 family protein [Pararhodospirillum photometricum]|uniref:Membrane-anchored protein n=1 Tax=Pararhodospirillum photometricum DSM 122 TaxID=1150469 RepID=H6SN54_PARPM|nr:DUF3422 domain-containing protein [Pararhodospirillum photometricum]CCG06930.1 Putative uncharacterized protein [Pararhodospirillum photometricum DSM 122]
MSAFKEHPLRDVLANELHTRAADEITAPAQISQFAVLTGEDNNRAIEHLAELCARMGASAPTTGANHFTTDLGGLVVRFERHTEFCSYAFVRRGRTGDMPFERPPLTAVPDDWLATLPGEVLAGVHIVLEAQDEPEHSPEELSLRHFSGNVLIAAAVGGGAAKAYSDLRLDADRFIRFLVRDVNLLPSHAGRTVQRLIEMNTYRALALLALPQAREASPVLREIDLALADIAQRMADPTNLEKDADLLRELSSLTARVEAIATTNSYRFAASRAYYQLVVRRLEDLRQGRLGERLTFSAFMDRRLTPAMTTCKSVADRTEALSTRGSRVVSLLRTRVEVDLQAQNQRLLESMDHRARLQLRLQQAVEGLSVVAIGYYMVGLVGYLAKGLKGAGVLEVSDTVVTGLAVPVVLLVVYLGLKRAKKAMGLEEGE